MYIKVKLQVLVLLELSQREKMGFVGKPKGRYGWGCQPYTLLTAIYRVTHEKGSVTMSHGFELRKSNGWTISSKGNHLFYFGLNRGIAS